jgi:hypothetical protein
MSNNEEKLYKLAQKKVKKKKGFYRHLQAFVMVNIALLFIGIMEGEPLGPFPVAVFWGIGLGFHYANVFGLPGGKLTDEWEERELEKEYDKLRNRYGSSQNESPRRRKEELDMDDHLDLRQPQRMKDYEDRDFV